ncbi:SET domain protein [Ostertagia ostertagi]
MLGNVLARKRGRRKKRNSLTPQIEHCVSPCKQEAQSSDDAKPCQNVQNRRNNPRRGVQDVSNHKITEFFPVRRSSRKTGKQLEEEEKGALRDAIYNMTNEALVEVYMDEKKGRGIRAGKSFVKNEFVIEYKGDMMDYTSAKIREEEYAKDPSIGSYMYFFKYKSKRWCVDATKESIYKGRLINHSALRPNLRTKVVEFEDGLHLILVAKRDIDEAEELLYDYGDRTPETVARNPWLVNS